MIASCGTLGLDYATVGLGEFLEAVEAHNASSDPGKPEPASPAFREMMQGIFKGG